jgi:hypothetical protein
LEFDGVNRSKKFAEGQVNEIASFSLPLFRNEACFDSDFTKQFLRVVLRID